MNKLLIGLTVLSLPAMSSIANTYDANHKTFYAKSDWQRTEDLACHLAKLEATKDAALWASRNGYNIPEHHIGDCNCIKGDFTSNYKCEVRFVATLKRP